MIHYCRSCRHRADAHLNFKACTKCSCQQYKGLLPTEPRASDYDNYVRTMQEGGVVFARRDVRRGT